MYYLFVIGEIICRMFPREACYFFARVLASAYFYFSPKDSAAVKYNLCPVVEAGQLNAKARQVFINFSYYLVDFFRYSKLNKTFVDKYVKVEGEHFLEDCLARKKGVVSITAHLGNYELGGAVAALLGYPIYAVALPHKDQRTNAFFNNHRRRVGIGVISTGAGVKQCFSLLKQGNMIAFLGDRDFSAAAKGVTVSMFSRQANIPRGAFYFALKTGAAIVPSFFVRENKRFYRLVFEAPIWTGNIESGALTEEEEALVINRYAAVLEKYLRRYPQQWHVFQRYWL